MLVHSGQKIKCSQCDITFSRTGSLRRHMQHQHNTSKAELHFTCEICGKRWKTKSALQVHLQSHQNQDSHVMLPLPGTVCAVEQTSYTINQENG